jgi:hypothetical protein
MFTTVADADEAYALATSRRQGGWAQGLRDALGADGRAALRNALQLSFDGLGQQKAREWRRVVKLDASRYRTECTALIPPGPLPELPQVQAMLDCIPRCPRCRPC